MLSLDTETTGLDPWHGTMPYIVTTCNENGVVTTWEWDVDPFTRKPMIPDGELWEIEELLNGEDEWILQNATFDLKILETLDGCNGWKWEEWPWEKIHDTQISAHMLGSCSRKDLTTLCLKHLNINVLPYEERIQAATEKARRLTRSKLFREDHGIWQIAEAGRPDMPSAGEKCWKADMWLPRAICRLAQDYLPDVGEWRGPSKEHVGDNPGEHPWWDLVREYADVDAETTIAVHKMQRKELQEKGLWAVYKERLKVLPVVHKMKESGITISKERKDGLSLEYEREVEVLNRKCVNLSSHPEFGELPANGRSQVLNEVMFDEFGLTSPFKTAKGAPSMNKEALAYWMENLDPKDKRYHFVKSLREYRQRKTAIGYMEGYERYWQETHAEGYYLIHPSLNATGTNTLRWSSSNPNQQNISKKEGFNLRYCFGPTPGRGWASLDYENIELRIPAYESGQQELIDLFERPDEPPFYGSEHLLNFSTVFEDQWLIACKESGGEDTAAAYIKENWKATWYQRCKNGDFAVQYGAIDRGPDIWNTADRAFGRMGCLSKLKRRFSNKEKLNQKYIKMADETGGVVTMPDLEVDAEHGYPLECPKDRWGRVSPTIPLNYHVQGTACWVIFRAMIKVQEYLDRINFGKPSELHWRMVMQVHDELVIDFPLRKGFQVHLRKIRSIMESCGDCIGVPLKVGCDLHLDNWSQGESLK